MGEGDTKRNVQVGPSPKESANEVIHPRLASIGSRRFWFGFSLAALVAFCVLAVQYRRLTKPDALVPVVALTGPVAVGAGESARYGVLVRDRVGAPIPLAPVRIGFGRNGFHGIAKGVTGPSGDASIEVTFPRDFAEERILVAMADVGVTPGTDSLHVIPRMPGRGSLFVSTDKPLYQPGQTIHIRAVAMVEQRPIADRPATIEVRTEDDIKVFRAEKTTSAFGVVSADFVLVAFVVFDHVKTSRVSWADYVMELQESEASASADNKEGGTGTRAKGEEGSMGNPNAAGRHAVAGPSDNPTRGPILRDHFPETLLWAPEIITDDAGHAKVTVPFADSITTWRFGLKAVGQAGQLGSLTLPLVVKQDFFVDASLPPVLTQGDEIAMPVSVFNYAAAAQDIALDIEGATGASPTTVRIAGRDSKGLSFRLRFADAGERVVRIKASGPTRSDAIERKVLVVPNGQGFTHALNARLVSFEVPGGGFSLFGKAPAQTELTAYGLMEFADLARASRIVDDALLEPDAKMALRPTECGGRVGVLIPSSKQRASWRRRPPRISTTSLKCGPRRLRSW